MSENLHMRCKKTPKSHISADTGFGVNELSYNPSVLFVCWQCLFDTLKRFHFHPNFTSAPAVEFNCCACLLFCGWWRLLQVDEWKTLTVVIPWCPLAPPGRLRLPDLSNISGQSTLWPPETSRACSRHCCRTVYCKHISGYGLIRMWDRSYRQTDRPQDSCLPSRLS